MHIAALGKVKAHQDKAKLSFKKFLYINTNNILKNKAKFKSIIAKTSKLLVNFKQSKKPTEGGAIIIKSVGINLFGSCE